MRLDNFDLNLLVAFDVLMQEQNVTKAANRLNVTQSAMSASLKRLRESFPAWQAHDPDAFRADHAG